MPKIISIKKKYDVRSTFFVRVDVIRSDRDRRVLKRIAVEGWEIGLHLINTVNDYMLLTPEGELKLLRRLLGVPIYGVTPCGSTIGFKGGVTWKIMDSLGLNYMEGYGMPDLRWILLCFRHTCPLTFTMLRILERRKDIEGLKGLLRLLELDGLATVLVHPEGFVRSVQGHGLMKFPLTLLRKGMINKTY